LAAVLYLASRTITGDLQKRAELQSFSASV
jgi:hypothetical protein